MGIATIVSGGEDGRYTISMDYGAATKTAILAATNALLVQIEQRLFTAEAKLVTAKEKEDEQKARVQATIDDFIATANQPGILGKALDTRAITFEMKKLSKLRQDNEPLRMQIAALKFSRAQTLARVIYWRDVTTTDTRQAWCATLTEDAAPGAQVATIDIPGDTNLMLIAPECRAPANSDGFFRARGVLSPEQAFFNAAIFPGWQKWRPTYRWGTITALDANASTASVELAPTTSSAQTLNINQATTLTGVEVEYMECGASVFEIDDRVVVQFVGQDWNSPKVVGFVDNPRPCNWPCIMCIGPLYFESLIPDVMTSALSGAAAFECRRSLNGSVGGWQTMVIETSTAASRVAIIRYDNFHSAAADQPAGFSMLVVYSLPGTFIDGVGIMPPHIQLHVTPSGPVNIEQPARPLESRDITEFRIRAAGKTIFNAAVRDTGWFNEPPINTGYARNRGGINLRNIGSISGNPVFDFDYELGG